MDSENDMQMSDSKHIKRPGAWGAMPGARQELGGLDGIDLAHTENNDEEVIDV